jgi:hypothetical protein
MSITSMIRFRSAGAADFPGSMDCSAARIALGAGQQLLLLFERRDLQPQGVLQFEIAAVQECSDLLQRDSQKLQRDDLLQPLEIAFGVEPVSRLAACGL